MTGNVAIKAVIFDLDGVIVTTDRYHYQAWKEIADQEGIDFDQETNHRLRGVSRLESLEIILEKSVRQYSEEEKQSMAERKNEIYKRLIQNLSNADILPGVEETLGILRNWGIKTAIGSSSRNAEFILDRTGLRTYFDAVSDGNGLINSKPDPEVFVRAASLLGIDGRDCLVVEDADAGVRAAKAAGMYAAAMGDAGKNEQADYRIGHLSEVLEICSIVID